jgi:demethylmenaquinone methyltransferase/2-methoxy-6-polyprenyl-1,4-benzoquinol methylase
MADDVRKLVDVYSRLAFIYDAWTWMTERKSLRAGLARADIRDGESVLEVAVGSGVVFRELLLRNPSGRNVGVDLTDAMLRRTRKKAERTGVPFTLERGDARSLPFETGSFGVALSNNMLGLLSNDDIERVLREMMRVLRPGGRIVLVTMTCPEHRAAGWVYRLGAIKLGAWRDVRLEPILRAIGFEHVERDVVRQLGIPSEILTARTPAEVRIR